MKNYILVASLAIFFFTACKDDEPTTDLTQTTTEKIQKKWELVSIMDYNYIGTTTELDDVDTVVQGKSGDYLDFKADNTVEQNIDGDSETLSYTIVDGNRLESELIFDGETYNITILTATEFVLTYEERSEEPYYNNVIRMKR